MTITTFESLLNAAEKLFCSGGISFRLGCELTVAAAAEAAAAAAAAAAEAELGVTAAATEEREKACLAEAPLWWLAPLERAWLW